MFLWRSLSGALAVSDCLRHHGLNTSILCSICYQEPETTCHVLFKCEAATRVWELANVTRLVQGFNNSLEDNLSLVFQLMEKNGIDPRLQAAIPWLLWGIWKHRNGILYAGTAGDLDTLVAHAFTESEIWNKLMIERTTSNNPVNQRPRSEARWLRPAQGVLKCNVNASWINDSNMGGGAWIARNYKGEALFHAREVFLPTSNRIAAELRCIIWALQSLSDLQVENIEIWSDCVAAVEAITDSPNWPRYRSLTARIHGLRSRFQKVVFHTSSLKANRIARDIAKSVTRDGRFQSYLARGGPAWLHSRLNEDSRQSLL